MPRSTPPEQAWPSLAKRKRMAAERREQEARRMRLEAEELDRKWSAYRCRAGCGEAGAGNVSRFLTMPQASERCGGVPSAETLYRLAREGFLPVKRIGRRVVISDVRLDEWMNAAGDARQEPAS